MCAGKIYLEYIHISLSQIHALLTVPSIESCNYLKNSNNLASLRLTLIDYSLDFGIIEIR